MPQKPQNKIRIFRITHRDNLAHILQFGICSKSHPDANPNYVSIGNKRVIEKRIDFPVAIDGYGNLGEYIPFYFAPRSIMLLNILTGYSVEKHDAASIVFLVSSVERISEAGSQFVFTDGQANTTLLTKYCSNLTDLDKVDWKIIASQDFKRSPEDPDRTRRYQAEFLVKDHVPTNCIEGIVVYDGASVSFVNNLLMNAGLTIPVVERKDYYFNL